MASAAADAALAPGTNSSATLSDPSAAAPAHVQCWACGVLVQIPIVNNELSPVFRCGWCGAISEAAPPWLTGPDGRASGRRRGFSSLFRGGAWRSCMRILSRLSYLVVLVVLALIGSIVLPGIGFVVPVVAGGSGVAWALHTTIAYLLSAAVLFNLFAAVATSPGKPHECCRGLPPHTACSRGGSGAHGSSSSSSCSGSASSISRRWWLFGRGGAAASAASSAAAAAAPPLVVPQYAYSHLRYCWSCRGPQPAEAQHCHVCGCCVVDLDHHCPFIANCVGRGNLRNFVSFLGAAVAAVAYCCAMALTALWLERRDTAEAMREAFVAASRASRASAELEDVGAAAAAFAAAAGGAGEHGAGGGRSGWLRAMAAASEGVVWFLGSVVPRLPLRVTVAAYIAAISVGVLLSVGILLLQTVRHIVRHGGSGGNGKSGSSSGSRAAAAVGGPRAQHHLHPASDAAAEAEAAARAAAAARSTAGLAAEVVGGCGSAPARRSMFASLRRVMVGSGPEAEDSVWMWVWPIWGPPPGVLVGEEEGEGEGQEGWGGMGAAGAAGRWNGVGVGDGREGPREGEGLDPELLGGGAGMGADACGGLAAAASAAAAAAAAAGVVAAARLKPKRA